MTRSQKVLCKGDAVRVRRAATDDEWCRARVLVASDPANNPQSVFFHLYECVRTSGGGIIAGGLPVFVDYQAETVKGLDEQEYEMEVQ